LISDNRLLFYLSPDQWRFVRCAAHYQGDLWPRRCCAGVLIPPESGWYAQVTSMVPYFRHWCFSGVY
jgi:hypothetical protein